MMPSSDYSILSIHSHNIYSPATLLVTFVNHILCIIFHPMKY